MSLMIVFGKWVTPHFRISKHAFGICFGFFAITIYSIDLETEIRKYMDKVDERQKMMVAALQSKDRKIVDLELKVRGYEFSKNE